MKQYWQQYADKIDAMTLRERALIFLMLAVALVTLLNMFLIEPQMQKHKLLTKKMVQERTQVSAVRSALNELTASRGLDPDAANRERSQQLKLQLVELDKSLQGVQKGLVSHEKMPLLLEDMLHRNGQLQLVNLKTLPVSPLVSEALADSVKALKPEEMQALIYKHGVEITVQGSYQNLINYLGELEKMPWQMFWGKARLDVQEYPKVNLTLTLYTLSLDKAWLSI